LRQAIVAAAARGPCERPQVFPEAFTTECRRLDEHLRQLGQPHTPHYLLERLLLDVGGDLESHLLNGQAGEVTGWLAPARHRLMEQGCKVPAIEARVRYDWVRGILTGVVKKPPARPITFSDKLDSFLTHRFAGLAFFVVLMFVIFQAIFTWAKPLMDACQ